MRFNESMMPLIVPPCALDVASAHCHTDHRHAGNAHGEYDRDEEELKACADAVAGQRLRAET